MEELPMEEQLMGVLTLVPTKMVVLTKLEPTKLEHNNIKLELYINLESNSLYNNNFINLLEEKVESNLSLTKEKSLNTNKLL